MAAYKRESGDYQQISAYIRKDVLRRMKIKMALEDCDQSTAIEAAIEQWVKGIETPKQNPQP